MLFMNAIDSLSNRKLEFFEDKISAVPCLIMKIDRMPGKTIFLVEKVSGERTELDKSMWFNDKYLQKDDIGVAYIKKGSSRDNSVLMGFVRKKRDHNKY